DVGGRRHFVATATTTTTATTAHAPTTAYAIGRQPARFIAAKSTSAPMASIDDASTTDDAVADHCFTCVQPSAMPACAANAVTIVAAIETARNAMTRPGMRNGGRDDDDDYC